MVLFEKAHDAYVEWMTAHRDGHVLNCNNPPTSSYVMLHTAACETIRGKPANGEDWNRDYLKIWSPDRAELESWATRTVGVKPADCGKCKP
jgi:hypothetical protein